MQEILHNQPGPEQKKLSSGVIILGVLVLVSIGLVLWFALRAPEGHSSRAALLGLSARMSPAELTYSKSVQIENIALSRAENFIHQEVTILDADAVNAGQQSIAGLAVTVEFFDDLHQVVLRETRGVLGTPPATLGPGQRRSFSISFDRVPSSWNRQQPSVQVTHLQLAVVK
ncbi:MAG TPA: hypothetical protein VNY24_00265 [Candidatus Acidoferrales bacterium]|nr:hypothetical protein [Candidatus Acidoferrales bacterium]